MPEFLTLDLGEQTFNFRTRQQLNDWWSKEKAHWEWIWADPVVRDLRGLANLGRTIESQVANDAPAGDLHSSLTSFFGSMTPSARYSGSPDGERYLNVVRLAGPAAACAVMMVEQVPKLRANLVGNRPDLLSLYAQGAAASYAGLGGDRARLAQERKNYRNAIDKLEERVRELEGEKDEFVELRKRRIEKWIGVLVDRLRAAVQNGASEFEERRDTALKTIADTEAEYRVQMALKAPVDYWRGKATTHTRWEAAWAAAMIVYFLLAAFAIYGIARQAAEYLMTVPDAAHATPIYIIVSGATIGATTLIFWLGRLITKLFLSEHHLAGDCREKAVMMQAFLSMETRDSFSAEERAIILASIFRSSPDGIVRDDGPADLGVQAILARQLAR